MASINRDPNGRRTIQFMAADGKRKSIRLGKVSQRVAEEIRTKIERLNESILSGCTLDSETAKWVGRLGKELADKLAAAGLIQPRAAARLGDFLDAYIKRRSDVKPNTVRNLEAAKARLVEFFGQNKNLRDITPGDADAWLLWLREKSYANGTTGRTVKRAKQFFRSAVRSKIIAENPFADVKPPSQVNESRKHFVSMEITYRVLDACPDAEWRLIVALGRFGGLRCPSELGCLEWPDLDWEKGRMRVHSPKIEHLEGGGDRWVPIFPELRPYLEEAFELASRGAVNVITRYRDSTTNLRTQMLQDHQRAGVKPWPKLFHNLRASRETELAAEYPIHVVCAWIGNTEMIAAKHYLQVTDDDFKQGEAAKSGARRRCKKRCSNPPQCSGTEPQEKQKSPEKPGFLQECAAACEPVQNDLDTPKGTRTPVLAVRGLCPRPLDDGGKLLPILLRDFCVSFRNPLCVSFFSSKPKNGPRRPDCQLKVPIDFAESTLRNTFPHPNFILLFPLNTTRQAPPSRLGILWP